MKTYIIVLSKNFPVTHSKAGKPTNFREKFYTKEKIHTIRSNYHLWEKRIMEVQEGKAVFSIRQWTGKPYRSQQVEIAQLTVADGIGIQRLRFLGSNFSGGYIRNGVFPSCKVLANKDGLSLEDWEEWFREYDLSAPLAIIHFTKFRY